MNVLVTGATGFVGRHLIEQLQADANINSIIALVREPADWASMDWTTKLDKVTVLAGGLHDYQQWQHADCLQSLDGIFHLAAVVAHSRSERDVVFHANVDGTLNMLQVAKTHQARLVYVSTSGTVACFDNPEEIADETAQYATATVGNWPYYASKIESEQQAMLFAAEHGVELVILRPPIMLGPGDHRFRSTGLILKALRKKLPAIVEGGFPFVDVRDAATAMLTAMQLAEPRLIYHLPGSEWPLTALFQYVEDISGIKKPSPVLPGKLVIALAKCDAWLGQRLRGKPLGLLPDPVMVEMGTHFWGMNSRYAAEDLAFNPRPGKTTIEDTVHWLLEHAPELQSEEP